MSHYDFEDRELTPLEWWLADAFRAYLERPLIILIKAAVKVIDWITVKADKWL